MTRPTPTGAPGLYLLHTPDRELPLASATGRLASTARREGWTLHFDGILTGGRVDGQDDAATALDRFLADGADALHHLDGFYNALLLHDDGRVFACSDRLSSRPWYAYRKGQTLALAPTPLAFARWTLPMALDRLELFHYFRFGHASFGRSLVEEVELLRPGREVRVEGGGGVLRDTFEAPYRPDSSLSLADAAERFRALMEDVIGGVLTHPRLDGLPLYLPLTAGLDSRQILAELVAQGATPDALQHVRFQEKDFLPTKTIADALGIPLHWATMEDLDWPALLGRWAERSAGLTSVHQTYLLHLAQDVPPGGALGFDGYLMDWMLAVTPWKQPKDGVDAGAHVWSRHYTRAGMMRGLLPDARALAAESLALFRERAARFDGPPWVQATLLDTHHRGLHYTGPQDTLLADEKAHFSPGAHRSALDFFLTVPRETGGDRRARLEAMRRFFPDLAAFPDSSGRAYANYDQLQRKRGGKKQYVGPVLRAVLSGGREDPAPETAHARLRQVEALREAHRRVAERSALVADGHLRGAAVRASWWGLRAGGYQAWTLMALFSAEVAYRLLVRQEPEADVLGLIGAGVA